MPIPSRRKTPMRLPNFLPDRQARDGEHYGPPDKPHLGGVGTTQDTTECRRPVVRNKPAAQGESASLARHVGRQTQLAVRCRLPTCGRQPSWQSPALRAVRALAFLVCFTVSPQLVRAQHAKPKGRSETAQPQTVQLTIDFGDGMQKRFPAISHPLTKGKKFTVADAMAVAMAHPRGIQVASRGRGATRFLESIDGLENEGAAGKNWILSVNGDLAQAGFGTISVEPGAAILWEFRKFP